LSGLGGLTELLEASAQNRASTVTLFVVGNYVERVMPELATLASAGHEIASHGPDHGRVPAASAALHEWLTKGRDKLEQALQVPVRGFRSPRFDLPPGMSLAAYRGELAGAGFSYVSDTYTLGAASPLAELPVLRVGRLPLGGGSYQRLLPSAAVIRAIASVASSNGRTVLYYHSYDFGATLPRPGRSAATAAQVIGRRHIPTIVSNVLARFGSRTCGTAALGSP
jgi:peptidoglycan/xylan/chitin deacetylase (PgdA/CDA1 family)